MRVLRNDRLLRACQRIPADATPVWFMRQAGRIFPEYRQLRERYGFRALVENPDLATEITLLPVRRLGVDAAILFADLATPLTGTGIRFSVRDGRGLVVDTPIRIGGTFPEWRVPDPEESVPFVLETVRRCVTALDVPLIGFVAAPFTLATYLIEGGSSRDYHRTRVFLFRYPETWTRLMRWLVAVLTAYGTALIRAGIDVIQVFDSWAGALAPETYVQHVLPHTRQLIRSLQTRGVPVIYFSTGTAGMLPCIRDLHADVYGIDWRVDIDHAWSVLGPDCAIQGNLDPAVLCAPWHQIQMQATRILDRIGGRPGHIFNLGHGVLPETPIGHLQQLVDWVHTYTRMASGE